METSDQSNFIVLRRRLSSAGQHLLGLVSGSNSGESSGDVSLPPISDVEHGKGATMPEVTEQLSTEATIARRAQTLRLARLGKDFWGSISALPPEKRQKYIDKHNEDRACRARNDSSTHEGRY